jgi:sugar phosphate isomerase/epimerase
MEKFSRRNFIKTSALAAAGTAFLPSSGLLNRLAPPPVTHLGLQLWSIREDMKKDPGATLAALAKMGYREVEGFGYDNGKMFGMPIAEYGKLLKDNGLKMPSSHCGFSLKHYDEGKKMLSDDAKRAIDDAAAMGQRYIICPSMNEPVEKLVKAFGAAADYALKAGVKFGFHNHAYEFEQRGPDGRLVMEWLLHEIDPRNFALEMDIYWVAYARHNPLDWFRLYPGRWELCHAKDLAATEKRETIEFGDGVIDFPGIFSKSQQAGMKYYIIELEHYRTTPMEGVNRARQNFVKARW